MKKLFTNQTGSGVIAVLIVLSLLLGSAFVVNKKKNSKPKVDPGVPILTLSSEPKQVSANQNFDLVLKVNPNGAEFHAFEIYLSYEPDKVVFQNSSNPSQSITSGYSLIIAKADPGSKLITIVGTRTGSAFVGLKDMELTRLKLHKSPGASGQIHFSWSGNTKLGKDIKLEKVDAAF